MNNIVTKRAYQSPVTEVIGFDTNDVVRTSNASEISYKEWANGGSYDTPFGGK